MWRKTWKRDFVIMGFLSILIGLGVGIIRGSQEEPDPERARFMLECTYDWSLAPKTCREILEGQDPPVPPPEYDGC